MPQPVVVRRLVEVGAGELEALAALLPQISSGAPAPDLASVRAVIADPGNQLLVAELDGRIVGTCLVATFPTLTGTRAWLEDVVVDESSRGAGIGTALVEAAAAASRSVGARTLDLTSRPSRQAANRLYARCGFQQRQTNVWRLKLEN